MQAALGAEVTGPERLARAPKSAQQKMTAAFSLRQRDAMLCVRSDPAADGDSPQIAGSDAVDADDGDEHAAAARDYVRWHTPMCSPDGEAPNEEEAERVGACREEAGAFLRAIPHNPKFLLSNGDFKGALAFRLGIPLDVLQRAGEVTCDCHRAHDARLRGANRRRRARNGSRQRRGGGLIHGGTGRRRPRRVDGKGRHDVRECPYGGRELRHTDVQTEFVALGKDADAWVRRTNVQELRVLRSSDSQRQGDVAIDNFGPEQLTMLTDFVITHPTAATSSYRTGQSGVAAARQEAIKEGKYGEAAAALNIRFIPFAMETYGKMGTKALRILRTLQQDLDDSSPASALRPWHARSFLDSAVQRLSIALQRAIQGGQIRRSHLRRVRRGGVPADYYECGGGAGYRRSSSPSSSGSSSSSRIGGRSVVSSP